MDKNIFYVYQYLHPTTKIPFYIGKGKKNRLYDHMQETKNNTDNYMKWCIIESLRKNNLQPIIQKISENLSENDAYKLETELILKYGRKGIDFDGILTNRCIDCRPPRWELYSEEQQKPIRKKCGDAVRGKPKSKKQKEKMSISRKEFFSLHPEVKDNISKHMIKYHSDPTIKEEYRQRYLKNPIKSELENNGRALLWKFISPTKEEFIVKGAFKHFCLNNNLSASTMKKYLKTNITPKSGKCVGWSIERIISS